MLEGTNVSASDEKGREILRKFEAYAAANKISWSEFEEMKARFERLGVRY